MNQWITALISLILGGGLWQGVSSLYQGIISGKKEKALTQQLGIKTPYEVEGIAVATMRTALEAAEARIAAMQTEREADREYYQGRISELETRLANIQTQLDTATREAHSAAKELAELRRLPPPHRGS